MQTCEIADLADDGLFPSGIIRPGMNFEALRASTLPGLLVERARMRPDRVAFRAKELGIWRETTWRELADRVGALACGLAREYRIAAGETVAIIGHPCPEWTIADLAAQALGVITYGIYDLTNYATLDKWSIRYVVVDIAWGGTICGIATIAASKLDRWFLT